METDWTASLRHVSPTPDGYQDWVGADYARSLLRCSEEEVSRLGASGIQTREGRFDRSDLWNAGLYSGSGTSRPELEMKFFGAAVSPRRDWTEPTGYRISLVAACPCGGDCTGNGWEPPRIPAARWHTSRTAAGEARWEGEVVLVGHRAAIRGVTARQAWRKFVDGHSFHFLFMREEQGPELTRARRVGDC
ncbi:hypothetical protein, partial [Bacillus mobilis]